MMIEYLLQTRMVHRLERGTTCYQCRSPYAPVLTTSYEVFDAPEYGQISDEQLDELIFQRTLDEQCARAPVEHETLSLCWPCAVSMLVSLANGSQSGRTSALWLARSKGQQALFLARNLKEPTQVLFLTSDSLDPKNALNSMADPTVPRLHWIAQEEST